MNVLQNDTGAYNEESLGIQTTHIERQGNH